MAEFVMCMDQEATTRFMAMFRLPVRAAAIEQRIQCIRSSPANDLERAVSGDGLCGLVPEHNLAVAAEQGEAFRKTVQCCLKKFSAIRHPSPSMVSSAGQALNLIALCWREGRLTITHDYRAGRTHLPQSAEPSSGRRTINR